ncbi:hypothetical protein GJAV_G00105320 [Gymnothorax javanicus]|nr:hypothetical protein GJAV_G00105320 [Gymnothorax javanicus]
MSTFGAANRWDRILNYRTLNSRGDTDAAGLDCLPGERVIQKAVLVRKKVCATEGGGWLAGTLFCTYFRLAFVPQDSLRQNEGADPVLLGDHDIALTSIEKVVAVSPFKVKHVTPSSTLRFTPEQLILYCRDMRVLCFLFDRLTPHTQVLQVLQVPQVLQVLQVQQVRFPFFPFEYLTLQTQVLQLRFLYLMFPVRPPHAQTLVIQMTYTLARAYQPLSQETVLSFQNATLGNTG